MTRRWALLPAWLIALLVIGGALLAAGHGGLRPPPVHGGRAALIRWAATRDAPTMLMSIVRVAALVLDAYLALTTLVGSAMRAMRWTTATRITDHFTLPSVRRLLAATVGTAALTLPLATPAFATAPPAVARLTTDPPVLRRVGATAPPTVPGHAVHPARRSPSPSTPAPSEPSRRMGAPPEVWFVRPGDNFWSIAARLAPPAEVVPYWTELIDANRPRLLTGDPNRIWPGQLFVIPPPPAR